MQVFRSTHRTSSRRRSGVTAVEVAVMMPIFGIILVGLMETGHAMMVIHLLGSAARQSARLGSVDGVTTAQVVAKATLISSSVTKSVNATVMVKDGSDFDDPAFDPETIDYSSLPNLEVNTAADNQLFIVRVTVPYNDVAIIPPFWIQNITLSGQAVMRHE